MPWCVKSSSTNIKHEFEDHDTGTLHYVSDFAEALHFELVTGGMDQLFNGRQLG